MPEAPFLVRLLVCGDPLLPFVDLDLEDGVSDGPGAGLCLTGPNAVGKSALLARFHEALTGIAPFPGLGGYLLAKFRSKAGDYYVARCSGAEPLRFSVGIEAWPEWTRLAADPPEFSKLREVFAAELRGREGDKGIPSLWCDAERCLLGESAAEPFAAFLDRLLREREEAFYRFLRDPGNRERIVAEVEREFEVASPKAMPRLREAWAALLAPSGLRADFGSVAGPFLDGGGVVVPSSRLGRALVRALWSTGLAFATGGMEPSAPQLFLDEPEAGLHPSLAARLVPLYRALAGAGSSLFVATNCPSMAAAFPPERRIRLERGEDGMPVVSRGSALDGASSEDAQMEEFGTGETSAGEISAAKPAAAGTGPVPVPPEPVMEAELADLIDEVFSFRQN